MGLFERFRKKPQAEPEPEPPKPEVYSGMRVEVTAFDGRMLFAGKLMSLCGTRAELYQYTESPISQDEEPRRVRIRGYNDQSRKAVYLEGTISPLPKHIWQVEDLTVARVGNDRAFFRLDTNLDATVTSYRGLGAGERPCKLRNISVGGACISSAYSYHEGDRLLLKVQLLEDRDISLMFCQVLRVVVKDDGQFEYGCCFLELNEAAEAKIAENIYTTQRKKRVQV